MIIASGNLATSRRIIMGVLGQCALFGIDENSVRGIVTAVGLPARALEELDFPISLGQELEICNALVRTLAAERSPAVNVCNASGQMKIEMLGVLGVAMRHASNAVEALETCMTYPQLTGGHSRFLVRRQSGRLLLSFTMDRPTVRGASEHEIDKLVQYCLVLDLVMTMKNIESILQANHHPVCINLPFQQPHDWSELTVELPCRVNFAQPEACLAYAGETESLALPNANPLLYRFYVATAREQSRMLAEELSVAERVSRWLWAYTPPPTRSEIASLLAMSERNLTRQLGREGTSYSRLLAQVQEERAKNFLRAPVYSIAEISHRLGYAEPAVFSRAFSGWTGLSPRAWRKLNP
jgi:AraC-like DNA-binding protein